MAGRHAAPTNKRKPLIITIVIIVAVAAIGGGIMFFMNMKPAPTPKKTPLEVTTASQQPQTTAAPATTAQSTTAAENASQPSSDAASEETSVSNDDIVVPTQAGQEVTYFNATFIPNGQAKDAESGEKVSLREALGTGYSEGAITFNKDGTFTDKVSSIDNSGKYVVQGEKITATYSSDKNMDITVTEWKDGEPVQFYINYGGCLIYFG